MLSPTIREDLGRLRQIEIARQAERRGRLATVREGTTARKTTPAFLKLFRHRTAPSRSARTHEGPALGDEPFVSLRLLSGEKKRVLSNH
jgi:hypothetical protein